MIRDQGPIYNLGYNVTSRDLPRWRAEGEERGADPNSGVISKSLNKNPVMKFVAASAMTMAVAAVATSGMRRGGVKLFSKLEGVNKPWSTQLISDMKSIRDQLDTFQGVTRTYSQGSLRDEQLFGRKLLDNGSTEIDTGTVNKTSNFFITREERIEALRTGRTPASAWTLRDEIQQRLVSSARRMPYELPAFYLAQKAVVDPLMGDSQDPKNKVNWFNPVDVLTDFVNESAKLAVTMVLPFEAGTAASKQGWRRFMTYGDDLAQATKSQRHLKTGTLTMQAILGQVGTDAVNVFNKTLNFSARTTGAFSAGLQEAQKSQIGLVDYLHKVRHSTPDWGQMSSLRKAKSLIDSKNVLDVAPGPFRGLGSGIQAGERRYREILASQEAYKQFLSLGPKGFDKHVNGNPVTAAKRKFLGQKLEALGVLGKSEAPFGGSMEQALQAELGRSSHGMQQVVRQWGAFSHGRPALGQKANTGSDKTSFHNLALQGEYDNILTRSLESSGVERKAAESFATSFNVSRPRSSRAVDGGVHLTNRISISGKGELVANNEADFFENMLKYLDKRVDPGQANLIKKNLESSIKSADDLFSNKSVRSILDSKIGKQFDDIEKTFLPQLGRSQLHQLPMSYGKFNKASLSPKELEQLQRRTASLTGLNMASSNGLPVSNSAVIDHLRRSKLDPSNTALMKGMLIDSRAMSKPWQSDGRNIFGLKKLTVESAIQKGIFRSSEYSEDDVMSILKSVAAGDPVGYGGQYALKGAWETQTGQVLDFSILKKSLRKTVNTLATEYQVPLLKFNPLQQLNWAGSQALRDKGVFQFIPGKSNQAFLRGRESGDDFYLWMKSGGRGSKGKVSAMSSVAGEPGLRQLQGTYKPQSAANAMFEKHARYAIKDQGLAPDKPTPTGFRGKVKNFFAVSENQPDSIPGLISRFMKRKFDLNNRQTFARLLSEGSIDTPTGKLTLSQAMDDATSFSRAARGFFGEVGGSSVADDFLTGAGKFDPDVKLGFLEGLSYNMRGQGAKTLADDVVSVSSLKTSSQLEEFGRIVSREDAGLLRRGSITGDNARGLQGARKKFIDEYLDTANGPGYWDRRVGTGTRLDAYKRDLVKYLTVRENALGLNDFSKDLPNILSRIDKMRSAGLLNQAQATESRAALMSMQFEISSLSTAKAGNSTYQNLRNAIDDFVAQSPSSNSRAVLNEIAAGKLGQGTGLLGRLKAAGKGQFGSARYEFEGAVFNPFGSDTILSPTFASTFLPSQGGSPVRAAKSVLGISTYKDPESFSGMSVIQSHLISRLDKPFESLGMGLDPTRFSGPLGMYAGGLVSRRVLPIVAGGTVAVGVDRTVGGYVNEKDQYGERVYSPYLLGKGAGAFVQGRAAVKGLIPGGETYSSEMERMENGEVPIRAGRWWALGNTPFKGGRIQYFRPSWYRRLKSGYTYTDQTYGTPLERMAYGYDFSPLRAVDPYRFERKHYYDRPYPETGEYFTGPWGPLTSALNMTVGKVLKPKIQMHKEELEQGLAQYARVGDFGAYVPPTTEFSLSSIGSNSGFAYSGAQSSRAPGVGGGSSISGFSSMASASSAPIGFRSSSPGGLVGSSNSRLAAASRYPTSTASGQASQMISDINNQYASAAYSPAYGTIKQPGLMDPRIIAAAKPLGSGSLKYQASQIGYEAQELAGIYGFALGGIRRDLGLGTQDMSPDRPVLASAGKAYGSTRGFWDLNIGGVGDFPLPIEGNLSNLEFSEIARRFIPKERKDIQYLNPIKNDMGTLYPWLPGSDYFTNFQQGDPYTHVAEGEMRLPGQGYERFHKLNSDQSGKYGLVDQHKILGDVAPWSQQYRELNSLVDKNIMSPRQSSIVEETRRQVEAKQQANEFTPYEYTYGNNDPNDSMLKNILGRAKERVEHADTYLNTKFLPKRTAVEDWERDNIYGATFPEWQNPVDDFLKPMVYKSTQRGPLVAASTMGFVGSLFGKTAKAKAIGAFVGGTVGLAGGSYGNAYEAISGRQFMPAERKKEIALEEYTDILTYVKNMHLSAAASSSGDQELASQFTEQAKRTMYGADIYQGNLSQIALAIPKRKREHFKEMLSAPVQERKRILDTSGRLERRIYQAAWGMPVEERPELQEYFSKRELPPAGWEGYNPSTSMDQVKIKIGQNMGLDMSEMGYYPQQLKEANLVNMSYPTFDMKSNKTGTAQRIRELMRAQNIQGDVIPIMTPYSGERIDFRAGTF